MLLSSKFSSMCIQARECDFPAKCFLDDCREISFLMLDHRILTENQIVGCTEIKMPIVSCKDSLRLVVENKMNEMSSYV